jgi:hypothetical protein
MSERKIVLYLEQQSIADRFQYSYGFKYYNGETVPPKNTTRLADYHVINSLDPGLSQLFQKLKIDQTVLKSLKQQAIDRIGIIEWKMVQSHLCRAEDRAHPVIIATIDSINMLANQKIPFVVKIEKGIWSEKAKQNAPQLQAQDLELYFDHDMTHLFMKKSFRTSPFRYRLYLDQRLLMEREYDINAAAGTILTETICLNAAATGCIKVVSDFGLQIKRIDVNDHTQYIYSNCFKLAD